MSFSTPLRELSGNREDFPPWRMEFFDKLRELNPTATYGATAIVMTDEEYANQQPDQQNIVPFVAPEDPGPEPDLPPADANQLQLSQYDMSLKRHLRLEAKSTEWKKINKYVNSELQRAAPAEALDLIKHPAHGMLRVTPFMLFQHLEDLYGKLSLSDLKASIDRLRKPYDPSTSFSTFIASHVREHHVQAENDQPMTHQTQLEFLDEATKPCGFLEPRKELWRMMNGTPDVQRFGGENGLATALLDFEKTISRTSTTASAGLSAAVLPVTAALPSVTLASLQAQILALQATRSVIPFIGGAGGRGRGGGGAGGGGRGGRGGGGGSWRRRRTRRSWRSRRRRWPGAVLLLDARYLQAHRSQLQRQATRPHRRSHLL